MDPQQTKVLQHLEDFKEAFLSKDYTTCSDLLAQIQEILRQKAAQGGAHLLQIPGGNGTDENQLENDGPEDFSKIPFDMQYLLNNPWEEPKELGTNKDLELLETITDNDDTLDEENQQPGEHEEHEEDEEDAEHEEDEEDAEYEDDEEDEEDAEHEDDEEDAEFEDDEEDEEDADDEEYEEDEEHDEIQQPLRRSTRIKNEVDENHDENQQPLRRSTRIKNFSARK